MVVNGCMGDLPFTFIAFSSCVPLPIRYIMPFIYQRMYMLFLNKQHIPRTGPQREREREREKGRGREFVVVRNCCMVDLPFTFTTLHLVCICS